MQEISLEPRCAFCGNISVLTVREGKFGNEEYILHCENCNLAHNNTQYRKIETLCPVCGSGILITGYNAYNILSICSNPDCTSYSLRKYRNNPKYRVYHLGAVLVLYDPTTKNFYYNNPYKLVSVSQKYYLTSHLGRVVDSLFARRKQ